MGQGVWPQLCPQGSVNGYIKLSNPPGLDLVLTHQAPPVGSMHRVGLERYDLLRASRVNRWFWIRIITKPNVILSQELASLVDFHSDLDLLFKHASLQHPRK